MIATRIFLNVCLTAKILMTVRTAQTIKQIALMIVENEAFDPGYGHQVNIGVKSGESQQNKKPLRTILYSKTHYVS